jgi:YHS domain-containing protein
MTKDPVCGMQVDEKKAPATSAYRGEHYPFCGQQCKDKFDQNPERYTSQKGEPQRPREPQHAR